MNFEKCNKCNIVLTEENDSGIKFLGYAVAEDKEEGTYCEKCGLMIKINYINEKIMELNKYKRTLKKRLKIL